MSNRFGWTLTVGILLLLVAVGLLLKVMFQFSVPPAQQIQNMPEVRKEAPEPPVSALAVAQKDDGVSGELRLKVPEEPVAIPAAKPALSPNPVVRPKPAAPAVVKQADPSAEPGQQAAPADLGQSVATVTELKGYVFATRADGKRRTLKVNSEIFAKERVDTDAKAALTIQFVDGTVIHQGEQGSLIMEDYLFDPGSKQKTNFLMTFLKGTCRIVTGKITKINPERFKVRTRMATVGVRGCEIGIKIKPQREDVYVVHVTTNESVVVDTTLDGRMTLNAKTREVIVVEVAKKRKFEVGASGTVVTIISGKEPELRQFGLKESDELVSESSGMQPAEHNIKMREDSAIFTIQPQSPATKESGK